MNTPQPRRRSTFWILLVLIIAAAVAFAASNSPGSTFGFANDDVGQAAYFVVILVFVGSALFGRGLGAGEVVRAAASWLSILLILVTGYAYRDELTGVGARLLGVLAPGVPISGRLAGEADAAVVIVRSIDGHFAVQARVDDMPLTLMVDTGASFVTLTTDDAARIGVDVDALRFTVPIRTANGMIRAAPIRLDRLAVGSIERRDVSALVAPSPSLDQSLLGMSFLNTLAGYTSSGDRLVLTP
jgi:aspartyl protease family protein